MRRVAAGAPRARHLADRSRENLRTPHLYKPSLLQPSCHTFVTDTVLLPSARVTLPRKVFFCLTGTVPNEAGDHRAARTPPWQRAPGRFVWHPPTTSPHKYDGQKGQEQQYGPGSRGPGVHLTDDTRCSHSAYEWQVSSYRRHTRRSIPCGYSLGIRFQCSFRTRLRARQGRGQGRDSSEPRQVRVCIAKAGIVIGRRLERWLALRPDLAVGQK